MSRRCQSKDAAGNLLLKSVVILLGWFVWVFFFQISLVEKYIEEKLLDRIRGFDMVAFTVSLQ